MKTIFLYTLKRMRGQILGWGICLGLLAFYLVTFYDTLVDQQSQLSQLLSSYPKELFAFFGGMDELFTPYGFLNVEFFSYMPIILGIFAVLVGSGLLAGDEENGNLDLILSLPISRSRLFAGKLAGFLAAQLSILILVCAGLMLGLPGTKMEIKIWELIYPTLSLLGVLLLFGTLAVLFSMLLPARRIAAMLSGVLLVASFFITSLAEMDEKLKTIARFSPLDYYQGGLALKEMRWDWFFGLTIASVICALLSWWRFERRDIRVAGEGSWKFWGR
jgi:ABC-2 type transport system permease protein